MEDNSKIDMKERGYERADQSQLLLDKVQCQVVLKALINFRVP